MTPRQTSPSFSQPPMHLTPDYLRDANALHDTIFHLLIYFPGISESMNADSNSGTQSKFRVGLSRDSSPQPQLDYRVHPRNKGI
jgi:hypothetical protein